MIRKQRKRASRRDLLTREGVITGWRASLHLHAEHRRGESRQRKGSAWLLVEGELSEPVAGVSGFLVNMFPANEPSPGQAKIPSVGSFVRVKPVMEGVVDLTEREFAFILTLLSSGRIASCSLAFQPPRYGRALIASIDFSSSPPTLEDDEDQSRPEVG